MNSIAKYKWLPLTILALGCGRSEIDPDPFEEVEIQGTNEICDGLDNDMDGQVDDHYTDEMGRYVHINHCGACNNPCSANDVTLSVECAVIDEAPQCVATACVDGYVISTSLECVDRAEHLCKPCLGDDECGDFDGAVCAEISGESRCTVGCAQDPCPEGYECSPDEICVPPSESCQCAPGDSFSMFCEIPVDAGVCTGTTECIDGDLTPCEGSEEICDGVDNDCNGTIDDPFVDAAGYYGVDIHNCGSCGIDCLENPLPENDLICGGPSTDPVCAMLCVDTLDGIQPGDHVDADLEIGTGCECVVISVDDVAGPVLAAAEDIDSNCDGADGIVEESYYVSVGGYDTSPGSPSHPMATISEAIAAASASLTTSTPRPHVFVSAGSYGEVLDLADGVMLHGGYSPDFLSLDPSSYVTEVHAPSWSASPGGAALTAIGVGQAGSASVDGFIFRGAAAITPGEPSISAYLRNCGEGLEISSCVFEAAEGVDGADGADGLAGAFASGTGAEGDIPRGAVESSAHECLSTASNVVQGGGGQSFSCGSTDVGGGNGGDSQCPGGPTSVQEGGQGGHGPSGTPGGSGGSGGWDNRGPMYDYEGCPQPICCGLAHFLVSVDYETAQDGEPGNAGDDGTGGSGCSDPMGSLDGAGWTPGIAYGGSSGSPGSGGGGGGAGGGSLIYWDMSECAFEDGLGGGGGGGGAGGCGGTGGEPGTAGGPSIAVLISFGTPGPIPDDPPVVTDSIMRTGAGGAGGRGGTGGDGGLGKPGGAGGGLDPEDKTTPTLAGPSSGGHGGHGGAGGGGGGGGGGCGGSSIGVWLDTGSSSFPGAGAALEASNQFELEGPGEGGLGGGGSTMGDDGADGEVENVVVM